MKFYYDLMTTYADPGKYYNEKTIRSVRVFPATAEIEKAAEESTSTLWPVHDPYGWSNIPVECKDIDEAYAYVLESENLSAYEYNHDI
jgi:hypothetical protein